MRQITKILTVMAMVGLLFSQAAYANSFSDFFSKSVYRDTLKNKIGSAKWWTSSSWSHKTQNFFVKSVYQDRIHGFAYKKAILPVGRGVELAVVPERVANKAIKNGDWNKAISTLNFMIKREKAIAVITGPVDTAKQWASMYGSLGYAYARKGEYDKGVENLGYALHYTPNDGTLYQNRGAAYLGKKDYFRALKDFEKAQSLGVNLKPEIINEIRIAAGK